MAELFLETLSSPTKLAIALLLGSTQQDLLGPLPGGVFSQRGPATNGCTSLPHVLPLVADRKKERAMLEIQSPVGRGTPPDEGPHSRCEAGGK
jgi:hypothetical protein